MKYKNKLYSVALITSPFIGLLSITPVVLYVISLSPEETAVIDMTVLKTLAVILFSSLNIFIQWVINILLYVYLKSDSPIIDLNIHWMQRSMSYVIVFLYTLVVLSIFDTGELDLSAFDLYPYIGNFVTNSFILLVMNLVITQYEKADLNLEKAEFEIRELIAQQEHLKQQVHPHFLFNALGNLQSLISSHPQNASHYAEKLSRYLRVSLTLAKNDIATIAEEIDFLEDYLYLQRMRFQNSIQYEIKIPNKVIECGKLPIFSLQLLFENAIKHNSFSEDSPLKITVKYTNDEFLEISNNKSPLFIQKESTGIGLQNLTQRYSSFSDEPLSIEVSEEFYKVKIKVLDCESNYN